MLQKKNFPDIRADDTTCIPYDQLTIINDSSAKTYALLNSLTFVIYKT